MKNKLIFLCLILFIAFAAVFSRLKKPSTSPVNQEPTKAGAQSFEIAIKGSHIYSGSSKELEFKGVTSDYFRFNDGRNVTKSVSGLEADLATTRSWGVNAVQLYVSKDLAGGENATSSAYTSDLQSVIDWCKENGMWVIINPVTETPWVNGKAVRTTAALADRNIMPVFLAELAKRYGQNKNVLFGLEAEPKYIDKFSQITTRIEAIRAFSEKPIIMPVDNFSGTINLLSELDKSKLENIILDIHVYATASKKTSLGDFFSKGLAKYTTNNPYIKYPLILGEFGGFWKEDYSSPEDLNYLTQIGEFADRNNIGFFAYSLDKRELSLFDDNGGLTPRGEAFKELIGRN